MATAESTPSSNNAHTSPSQTQHPNINSAQSIDLNPQYFQTPFLPKATKRKRKKTPQQQPPTETLPGEVIQPKTTLPSKTNDESATLHLQFHYPPSSIFNVESNGPDSRECSNDHHGNKKYCLSTSLPTTAITPDANIHNHSVRVSQPPLPIPRFLPNSMDVGIVSMTANNTHASVGSICLEPQNLPIIHQQTSPPIYVTGPYNTLQSNTITPMTYTQEMHNINMHMKIMTTNQTTDLQSPENPLFSPKPISAITPTSPNFSKDLELQELLNILLEDLYTNPLIEYEPSITFQVIKENCSEITFSPKVSKTYIFSSHLTIYRMSFILQNPTIQTLPRRQICSSDHPLGELSSSSRQQCNQSLVACESIGQCPQPERANTSITSNDFLIVEL